MAAEGGRGAGIGKGCGGFNGAAAGWPRKVGGEARGHRNVELQWGRGRMAAEGPPKTKRYGDDRFASMGPRPDGRGRTELPANIAQTVCFNGAAAGWPRKEAWPAPQRCQALGFNGAAAGWPRKE